VTENESKTEATANNGVKITVDYT